MKPSSLKSHGFALVFATACLGIFGASCNQDQLVELTIFHTNDIHSHLKAPKAEPFELGGIAKLGTLLKDLRAKAPVSLTLDAGDWSEGTWYYNVDEGANMLRMLDAMGYDAVCLGNHDFLQGPDQLIQTIQSAKASFPVLAANLDMSGYSQAAALTTVLSQTFIKTVGGVRIGIIGLTTDQEVYAQYMAPVHITDLIQTGTRLAEAMRPKVDVLLLLTHNDFTTNETLAQDIPGVDAVISGHSHVKTPKPVMVNNAGREVPVVETGYWGEFLGDLKLSVDLTNHSVRFENYLLHPVTPDLADDPVVAALVQQQDQALNSRYNTDINQVVADSEVPLLQQDTSESLLGNLAVEAYRYETSADVSLEEISLTGVSVPQGNVTLQDLHDVVPHIYNPLTGKEWTLYLWNARGSDLMLVVATAYTLSNFMPLSGAAGWFTTGNAVVTWNPSGTLATVASLDIGGKPLDSAVRYKVVLTAGLLSALQTVNSDLHLGLDFSELSDTGVEAWRAVVDYAKAVQHLTVASLGVGKRARTTTPDLAIFYYDMTVDGKNLNLVIHNNGLALSKTSTLDCYSGIANDEISYNSYPTDLETWTSIGSLSLAAIPAGGSVSVSMPWNQSKLSGFSPVKCDLSTQGDPYDVNNHARRVFHF